MVHKASDLEAINIDKAFVSDWRYWAAFNRSQASARSGQPARVPETEKIGDRKRLPSDSSQCQCSSDLCAFRSLRVLRRPKRRVKIEQKIGSGGAR